MGMMINRRRVYGGKSLPYDAEVEWLSSDGYAYIDTGIKTTSDIRVEATFTITSKPKSNGFAIYGGRIALGDRSNVLWYYGDGGYNGNIKFSWRYGNVIEIVTTNGSWSGDYAVSNLSDANTMVISGACNATMLSSPASFSIDHNIYIYALNNDGKAAGLYSVLSVLQGKTYKLYSGSTLVRDYIPVRVGQVGYLYDKVSKTLFGNANSVGAFTFGNDKN